ncbi:hypothetical protein A9Q84_03600 [Halobacteriovorax marinus]|uniref:Uncharacterized protein n=1 Tax=Halobacteriovorax marinus TaxID=97084 RepID=A0A1Y5FAI0_9BACT|nr:hypothetical protein A9Q84_03600 [Halobacteriovorax marinus]
MATSHPFKGQIKLVSGSQKSHMDFEVPEEDLPFSETLMNSYSGLKLTMEEKRELSLKHRKIIHQYQSIDDEVVLKYVKRFINALPRPTNKKIKVKTKDFGSYICLMAISSGKIPDSLNLCFELEDTPVGLFPKKLLKKVLSKNIAVKFILSKNSWVKPFKTIYQEAA